MSEQDTPGESSATNSESETDEKRVVDQPHYAEVPSRCPKCPEGQGNLVVEDATIYGPTAIGVDVLCETCGYDGNAITATVDFEDKNENHQSAVKNGDLNPIYKPY